MCDGTMKEFLETTLRENRELREKVEQYDVSRNTTCEELAKYKEKAEQYRIWWMAATGQHKESDHLVNENQRLQDEANGLNEVVAENFRLAKDLSDLSEANHQLLVANRRLKARLAEAHEAFGDCIIVDPEAIDFMFNDNLVGRIKDLKEKADRAEEFRKEVRRLLRSLYLACFAPSYASHYSKKINVFLQKHYGNS